MTAPQTDAASDPQRTIAALQQRLDTALTREAALAEELAVRTAALAERNSEYSERIEHQAATIDVLKVMAASPGDPQPVFDLIVRQARAQCNSANAALYEYDGMIHCRSIVSSVFSSDAFDAYMRRFPMPLEEEPDNGATVSIRDRRIVHIRDANAEAGMSAISLSLGIQSGIAVPLIRGNGAAGCIVLTEMRTGGYSDSQIELLKTFAEQAVIAISGAETYRALQTRTSDLQETLEYQTATSDVLKVISRSTFDLQPVLDTLVETAARLCEADQAVIVRREGESAWFGANHGFPPEYEAEVKALGVFPLDRGSPTVSHRTLIEGRPIHIHDVAAVPGYPEIPIRVGKQRTSLGVPLLREGVSIGMMLLARQRVEPFTNQQIELVNTFTDQAVIAIENTRLLSEQREALEQQTATAEVLGVINRSPGDLAPVFDAMLEKAIRLCESVFGILSTYDGECFHTPASRGVTPALADFLHEPIRPRPGMGLYRLVNGEDTVHVADITDDETYRLGAPGPKALADLGGARAVLLVALRKDGALLGAINIFRQEVRPFSDKQIALLQNFAAQAVIAMENARLIAEQREALEQQTATAEVLQVINASPGNLTPVFNAILEKAHRVCAVSHGSLDLIDGEDGRAVAVRGLSDAYASQLRQGYRVSDSAAGRRVLAGEPFVQIADAANADSPLIRRAAELEGIRTVLAVPLRKDKVLVGAILSSRREVRPFSEKEVSLLQSFAAQAVIAMENARLLGELRQRTDDLQESLEYQTATSDVLKVISQSGGELGSVLDTLVETAARICRANSGFIFRLRDDVCRMAASFGVPEEYREFQMRNPIALGRGTLAGRTVLERHAVHIEDAATDPEYTRAEAIWLGRQHTMLGVPLVREDALIGVITLARSHVEVFTEKQIELVSTFADQAVIAIENTRLFDELRARTAELAQRQDELRITFENMGDGVAMFDETPRLVAWNRKFQEIFDVPDALLEEHRTYAEYVRYLGTRGDFGPTVDVEEQIRRLTEIAGEYHAYERVRPDGRVIEIRHNPVPSGGFVLIYADITERKRNEAEIRAARDAAEEASRTIEAAYRDLKAAQANLIQAEKMASLGQLTAGIAHEIKNPLNFVNNFSALSTELIDELQDVLAPEPLGETARTEVEDLTALLKGNLEKVVQHGQRADGIVKAMLEHSRGSSGERRMVDLNALIDEALNLAYHGARAQDQTFNIMLERDFGADIAPTEVNPQDITRVFLNLFSNGFYASTRRAREGGDAAFVPMLKVSTRDTGDAVEIRVRDNGTGIPTDISDKLFQPFFTTKPTGEGTGLGLSITYDIITKAHGGSIAVDSKVGEYSEFTIRLPRNP